MTSWLDSWAILCGCAMLYGFAMVLIHIFPLYMRDIATPFIKGIFWYFCCAFIGWSVVLGFDALYAFHLIYPDHYSLWRKVVVRPILLTGMAGLLYHLHMLFYWPKR